MPKLEPRGGDDPARGARHAFGHPQGFRGGAEARPALGDARGDGAGAECRLGRCRRRRRGARAAARGRRAAAQASRTASAGSASARPRASCSTARPGTGKTLLAKATAREAEANFIATKSSDLLSKWYGESEQQIARLFARARQVAPTVIFIDELDSLVPARGGSMGEPQVTERVVNTILAEMDGLEELQSVVVIGATNRPNLIDPALLRPGRFDELIYVPVPGRGRAAAHPRHPHQGHAAGRRRRSRSASPRAPSGSPAPTSRIWSAAPACSRCAARSRPRRSTWPRSSGRCKETRASVTPEMEAEYEKIEESLKQEARSASGGIGFIAPGMLTPRGPKG